MRITAVLLAALTLGACATSTSEEPEAEPGEKIAEVVIATHDSWAAPKKLIKQFEDETGYDVTILPSGDAGALTNKLVLTKDSPIADGVYGIDNTFATRALDEDVFADYRSDVLPVGDYDLPGGEEQLSPIDWGDVCVNVDDTWFDAEDLTPPATLDDLLEPEYQDLFVTSGAASSSPGFAFLLATIGTYGEDGWQDYWADLMKNGAKLTSGWEDAYFTDFTFSGGDRPIVLSYNSSPPFTIDKKTKQPATSALLDTCFRQVEYAGVLQGANNPEGAQAFIDFLQGRAFQESLPNNMYVMPVDPGAELPAIWAKYAEPASDPIEVDPAAISENRAEWLTEWGDLTTR